MEYNDIIIHHSQKIQRVMEALDLGQPMNLSNVKTGLKGFLSSILYESQGESLLYITSSDREAGKMTEALKTLGRLPVVHYPLEPIHAYFSDAHSQEITHAQVKIIESLLKGKKLVVVASADSLLKKMLPAKAQRQRFLTLSPGDVVEPSDLIATLLSLSYSRVDQVEAPGQFAVRGGIVDVFSITASNPIRIDFFDDEVDTIRSFSADNQRSIKGVKAASIAPAHKNTLGPEERQAALAAVQAEVGGNAVFSGLLETLKNEGAAHDEALLAYTHHGGTLLDYLSKATILWDEPERTQETVDIFLKRAWADFEGLVSQGVMLPREKDQFLTLEALRTEMEGHPLLSTTLFLNTLTPGETLDIHATETESFKGQIPLFVKYVEDRVSQGFHLYLGCKNEKTRETLHGFLEEQALTSHLKDEGPGISLLPKEFMEGFELPESGLAFVNESEIFKERSSKKRKRRLKGKKIDSFSQLKVGDYVVHDVHGIGIYKGVEQLEIDGLVKDLMVIEYAADARFFLPIEEMDAVQAYIGTGGDRKPKLNKLGHPEWARAKSRAKKAVEDMAEELIELYAKRRALRGYAFGPDTSWQQEFEEAFPFDETDDQLRSVEEIKGDMEQTMPMDRLLCGDVGYGKTEVALRGAFKAIMEGKQVALLVPTTILAQQHYNTIVKRFAHYPIEIDLISRFKTAKEQRQTVMDLAEGKVDFIIGTHRLLSKDIAFKDLGLLIVDEEQRFGVRSKEKLKTLRENVDVLTLSATPIPRTLHMSMTGIRDMSVIEEPPKGRRPVQTYVMQYNPVVIADAMERELARGGQVFFLHNRVHDILEVAAKVALMVPDARIVVAHGQMTGAELEDIMMDFIDKKYDILVTTTIVESGMDVPNANTMIIDNGDRFGLSQLYQLRGRVGRSERQAYCYVTHQRQNLTEVAQKRLKAIKDFTAFGSGFKVAMRDLEIRGAGNLLGAEQSGHMFNIGYEMYCRILEETITSRMEGREAVKTDTPLKINLDVDAYVKESYIESEELKFDVYKKISYLRNQEDYKDLLEELSDRFGPVPQGVKNLMTIAVIKHLAQSLGVVEIRQRRESVRFYFDENREMPLPNPNKIPKLFKKHGVKFKASRTQDNVWSIVLKGKTGEAHLEEVRSFLKEL